MRSPARCLAWAFLLFAVRVLAAAEPLAIEIPIQPASYGAAFFEETGRLLSAQRPGTVYQIAGDPRINDKIRVRAMAGAFPDATDAVLDYETLIASGKILNLAEYLDGPNWEGTGRWRDDFIPGILERWQRGDAVYGLPYAYAPWLIFYNKALFEVHGWEEPKTWDEWFSLGERMRSAGVSPLSVPGIYLRYADALLRAGIYQRGGPETFRRYQTIAAGVFVEEPFVAAAADLQRTGTTMLMPGWEGMTHTGAQLAMIEGRAAMNLSGAWFLSEMRQRMPADFRLGVMNLPQLDPEPRNSSVQAQAAYYFLFANGDKARERATIDYFRYLTSRERARVFVQEIRSTVALRTVPVEEHLDPNLQAIARIVAAAPAVYDAAPPPSQAFQSWQAQGLNEGRLDLVSGKVAPEEFAQRLEQVAAGERARIQNPDAVVVRHPGPASLLGGVVVVLAWIGFRRRGGAAGGPPGARKTLLFETGFVAPALLLFGLFVLLPGVVSLVWAFRHDNGFGASSWAGLFNFKWLLLESDAFWVALRNNLFLMLVPTAVVVPTALVFAALIHRGVWGAHFFRAVFLFPNLLGGIAAALLWLNAFDPHSGLVNASLVAVGEWIGSDWLRSFAGHAWLGADRLYWSLIPVYLWMACGFNLVLYLAAMQGIDEELYEAAEMDGAPPWKQFFVITLPLIWDVIVVSAVFIVIAGLNTFEMVWLMTSQDPTSRTHVLSTLMVTTLFREFQVGRATAIAVVMFVLVFVGSIAVQRVLRRGEQK